MSLYFASLRRKRVELANKPEKKGKKDLLEQQNLKWFLAKPFCRETLGAIIYLFYSRSPSRHKGAFTLGLGRATFFMVWMGFWANSFSLGWAQATENLHKWISGRDISNSGHIRAASEPHSGRILAAFWPHSGRILATFWPYSGRILVAFWPHSGRIWAAFGPHLGCIWAAFKSHLGSFWAAFRPHLGHYYIQWRPTKVETTGATLNYQTLISRLFETFLDFETKKQVVPRHAGTP